MQNENKDMLRKSKVRMLVPVLSFGLLLSTLAFYGQTVVSGSHAAPALIKHEGAISSASHRNHSRISASGLVVADATQVAVALPTTTPNTLIAATTPTTDISSSATATTADAPAATLTTASDSATMAGTPAATVTTASDPATLASKPAATATTADTTPAATVTTANTPASTVTTANAPAATATTASATATTADTTPAATVTTASNSGNSGDTPLPPKTVTVWVQTIDSCRQAIGGAFYALSLPEGPVLQVMGPVPGTHPVTVSTVGGCPIPRGNCLTIMTGCISFVLPVPASGQSNFTITEIKAPKGFVPCLKATKCSAPAKVNVTVFPNGTVSATTTIVFGNGEIVTFPRSQMSPVLGDVSDGSNTSNPTTIVVQDGRIVQPASATTTLGSTEDIPGAAFTMTQADPALVYNNQVCNEKGKKHCEGKGMVVRAITKVAVGNAHSQTANVKRATRPVKSAR